MHAIALSSTRVLVSIRRPSARKTTTTRGAAAKSRRVVVTRAVSSGENDDAAEETKEAVANNIVSGRPRVFPEGMDPSNLCIEQLAFLSRKEQNIMPDGHNCERCDGVGTLNCTACRGSGTNHTCVGDNFNEEVRLSSNAVKPQLLNMTMQESGPCWICRGAKIIMCTTCSGTGKKDYAENFICD